MAIEQYQKVDKAKSDKLPFIMGSYPFAYLNQKHIPRLGVIHEINESSYTKFTKLFGGKDEKMIGKGDKVYVLSGCKIPQFKIKDFLRTKGAIMTGDITAATLFVGNDRVFEHHSEYEAHQLNSLSMIMRMCYYNATQEEDEDTSPIPTNYERDDVYMQYYSEALPESFRFSKLAATYNQSTSIRYGGLESMYCITPYVANVAYELLSRKIPTISDECLMKQLPNSSKLDADLCGQLIAMAKSSDEDNHKVAHEILANSDYKDAEFYIYKLAKDMFSGLSHSRYKNIKLFVEESEIGKFYFMVEEEMVNYLYKHDKLNKEALDYLMPKISRAFETGLKNTASSIFQVKYEVRPEIVAIMGEQGYNKEIKMNPLGGDD